MYPRGADWREIQKAFEYSNLHMYSAVSRRDYFSLYLQTSRAEKGRFFAVCFVAARERERIPSYLRLCCGQCRYVFSTFRSEQLFTFNYSLTIFSCNNKRLAAYFICAQKLERSPANNRKNKTGNRTNQLNFLP